MGVLVRCWAIGVAVACAACGGTVSADRGPTDEATVPSPDAGHVIVAPEASDVADAAAPSPDADDGSPSPDVTLDEPVAEPHPLPVNFIEFATCEGDPDEVAVRNGATSDPCSEVTAIAWHVDADLAAKVPSTFVWSVEDPAVAQLVPDPGHEYDATRRLVTGIDLVADGSDEEPGSVVMACATPEWAAPGTVDPVCGTLPVHAVVSLAGTWCFEGGPFGAGCTQLGIEQNGRYLCVDTTGQGNVQGRHLDFSYGAFELQADLADADTMTGTYWTAGTTEVLGEWSATRSMMP